jgi:hypothetical protein
MQNEKSVARRIRGYWHKDGLGELAAGLVFFILALYFVAVEAFGETSPWGGILQASLVLVLLGLMVIARRVMNSLKERFVYPRTGYVEYRSQGARWTRGILAGLVAAMMAAVIVFVSSVQPVFDVVVAFTGLVGAFLLIFWSTKAEGTGRFLVMAVLSVLFGLGLSFAGIPDGYALAAYYTSMALTFVASGFIVLRAYLRAYPKDTEAL